MEGSKVGSKSSRVRNPYDEKKKEVCDHVLRVTQPKKLLVVRILDETTNVWEDGKALSLTVPMNHLFLKHNMYVQNNALSV